MSSFAPCDSRKSNSPRRRTASTCFRPFASFIFSSCRSVLPPILHPSRDGTSLFRTSTSLVGGSFALHNRIKALDVFPLPGPVGRPSVESPDASSCHVFPAQVGCLCSYSRGVLISASSVTFKTPSGLIGTMRSQSLCRASKR